MSANLSYRVFTTQQVVTRAEKADILRAISEHQKKVFIVEGDRGAGKTFFLLDLYHHFLQDKTMHPFFVGLFRYQAPEFEKEPNIWLQADKDFTRSDVTGLLKKLSAYLEIDYIESLDEENRPEYMARSLAKVHKEGITPVLLIDSIYECDEAVRIQIEKYVLVPFLTTGKAVIILSGRGKRPIWTNPELRDAQTISLGKAPPNFVKEQLEKMGSQHIGEIDKILKWSDGYPLLVKLLGQVKQLSLDALNDAIDVLIEDTLLKTPEIYSKEIRDTIQKLALLTKPFRIPDVDTYLFLDDEQKRLKADRLVKTLLQSYLLFWGSRDGRNGYMLNDSVAHPVREWLQENPALMQKYQGDWDTGVDDLQKSFPNVNLQEYKKMLAFHSSAQATS